MLVIAFRVGKIDSRLSLRQLKSERAGEGERRSGRRGCLTAYWNNLGFLDDSQVGGSLKERTRTEPVRLRKSGIHVIPLLRFLAEDIETDNTGKES